MKIFFFALIIIFLSILSCENQQQKDVRLARQYCGSCHVFPEPSLLDKKTWEKKVMPEMAFRMGLDNSPLNTISFEDQAAILMTLPDRPMISEQDWESIKKYYHDNAPDSLTIPDQKIIDSITQFDVKPIRLSVAQHQVVTLIAQDSAKDKIYIGTRQGRLYEFNHKLEVTDSLKIPSAPSKVILRANENPTILFMGIMDPNEQPAGNVSVLQPDRTLVKKIDSLQRPVDFECVDFNNDNVDDYVVCNFGNYTGSLAVYQALENGKFRKHFLSNASGARRVITRDFDGNGLPDILALMTQGDERILLFYNQGNFQFRLTTITRFDAVQGSSYMDIADFNNDGKPDIVYTNGDNADYSSILKPYHGVRIFLNSGTNEFKESWFYPMHGASQARVSDYDKDGDLDIAVISFFPDFKNLPDQGFIYFENTPGGFKPQITRFASKGRWMTMESFDYDLDGDKDILLGSLTFPNLVPSDVLAEWRRDQVSILLLENKLAPK
ncbi:MAG TPA: VCBS repeat-containing protein [Chryseolinea sp.]|nr:VCBS repeat-containing protein [Chryseolinea sp.]